jgi:hypothetical protein
MTYGSVVTVPAPMEAYLASHAEVEKALGDSLPDGMIVHVVRPVDEGFEVFEIWESKAQADKFNQEVVWPAVQRTGRDMSGPSPVAVEFEPVGLMVTKG